MSLENTHFKIKQAEIFTFLHIDSDAYGFVIMMMNEEKYDNKGDGDCKKKLNVGRYNLVEKLKMIVLILLLYFLG